ncbi:SpoIIIAH-like family protein [Sporolactobacillus sp. THM7-4]|nr:SpoIIIAH-like family protein [Sporolactobacillus sp. THM7-4]
MLKKQTVWLLTMLSLIVVLSVYALTSPEKPENPSSQNTSEKAGQASAGNSQKVVTATAAENKLAEIELEKADQRNELEQQYENVIASEKSSTEQVSAAYDKMKAMKALANNEMILEDVIQAKGFKDAVVKTDGEQVQIFVNEKKLTGRQANEMIKLANEYLGTGKVVSVNYALGQ